MRNTNRKIFFSSIFIALFFSNVAGFFLTNIPITTNNSKDSIFFPEPSQLSSRNIRIAIYDDDNITRPSYAGAATLTNNHSDIQNALLAAGYDVSLLTTNQIYNHELKTAIYDVFIMADHLPKENITNDVEEFWLGGGALLSMDSAVNYICYVGILPPESAGNDGNSIYWTYQYSSAQNITTRHPVSKEYALNDTFTISSSQSSATFSWTALQGTSIANEVVKVATRPGLPDAATVVAFEPQSAGGKVVHLPSPREIEDDEILIDAIEWLCPRPKGRILFDLSHENGYGVDLWDNTFTHYTDNRYTIMRNNLVNRDYTFDKLYPTGSDTFTMENLSPYDLLIVNLPDTNVSASEVSTLSNWVHNGGGLLAMGDQYVFDGSKNLNYLFSPYDLRLINDNALNTQDTSFEHPTIEGCATITLAVPSEVNYSGDAYPLWGSTTTDIGIAGQEYGNGRIVLIADINAFDNTRISSTDNLQYSVNLANWLTADDAKVLVFVYEHSNPDPNDNIYRGPIATALNDLGYPFYMTFDETYLNLSLADTSYKLVIIDNVLNYIMDTVGVTLLEFLKSGGYLILNTWEYRADTYNYLWDYLGFSYAGNYFNVPQTINIWDTIHPIFKTPADYGATTLETSLNFAGTDYTNLTLHSNATGIAGLTSSANSSTAAIILGANGHSITNAMHLTEYYDDTDDSTYPDALEIWENEIAYMLDLMAPAITPGGGIPGFEIGLFLLVTFSTIGVISIIVVRKKKN